MIKRTDDTNKAVERLERKSAFQENEINKLMVETSKLKETQVDIEKENTVLIQSLEFAHIQIAELDKKVKEQAENEKATKQILESMQGDNNKLKTDTSKNRERNIKAEAYSRRSNLRFEGIPYSHEESNVECRNKVYEVIKTQLGILDADKRLVIERCHRDPKFPNQSPPSVIARFLSFRDRQEVWERRNKTNQNRNNRYYINEDFPLEVEKKRSFLRPYVKAAYANNMKATLIGDTLLVEGNKYTVDELHKLPEAIRPE